ncbi:hypothetical protein BOTNAR_0309g00120 [Botryotinia narcissicola]|uniref:Uncharacterized protein n=1 Tax=Botryotinia narcissicola TaxID=278944 RepID=A0A4Z1HUS3_9HELO|nr:hypothetical protein BOTNAR_0309g00120 [Botryotinia narcissicola]
MSPSDPNSNRGNNTSRIPGNAGYVSLQKRLSFRLSVSDEADSVSKAYIPDEFDAKPSHAAMQSTLRVNGPRS